MSSEKSSCGFPAGLNLSELYMKLHPNLPVLKMQCCETPRTGRLNKLSSDAMFFFCFDDDNFGIPVVNNASGEQSAMLGNICERYGNKFDL